jgi:trimethylamine:corrinoid methyltransferase-like protein
VALTGGAPFVLAAAGWTETGTPPAMASRGHSLIDLI